MPGWRTCSDPNPISRFKFSHLSKKNPVWDTEISPRVSQSPRPLSPYVPEFPYPLSPRVSEFIFSPEPPVLRLSGQFLHGLGFPSRS
jgi:hypothetical protein